MLQNRLIVFFSNSLLFNCFHKLRILNEVSLSDDLNSYHRNNAWDGYQRRYVEGMFLILFFSLGITHMTNTTNLDQIFIAKKKLNVSSEWIEYTELLLSRNYFSMHVYQFSWLYFPHLVATAHDQTIDKLLGQTVTATCHLEYGSEEFEFCLTVYPC
jgi:hypothetical protein